MRALYLAMTRRSFALIACETALIGLAVAAAAWVRGGEAWVALTTDAGVLKALLIAVTCQLCLYMTDLYDPRVVSDRRGLFIGVVQALGATSFLLAAVYFWAPSLIIGRGVFLIAAGAVVFVVVGWRVAFEWLTRQVAPRERLLLVGTGTAAVSLARELFNRRQALGVEIVGFVDPDPARVGMPLINPGIIGTIEDIPSIVRARGVDRVVVSLSDARGKLPMDTLLDMKLNGVTFDHLASIYEELTGKIAVENLRPSWLIFSSGFKKSRFVRAQKRAVDVVAGLLGFILGWPLLLLVAAAVRFDSPGPILYRQQRVGRQGRIFEVIKFRSMRQDAEAATGAVWARQNDDRITRVGRFMRRSRLDELPQLWNILVGDMSLIGPRPERPEFVTKLTAQIPFYGQRHVVRPGLTGWAQVRYTYGNTVEDALEKLQYDLFYIKNLSVPLDVFIVFSTIKTVLLRKGA
jgi:sugar transferase (PEP-CTERM system associated)